MSNRVSKADLEALLARVEAATGPDREIDCALAEFFGLVDEAHCKLWCSIDRRTDITREMFVRAWSKHYTESIDAAVALCEHVLPRSDWQFCKSGEGTIIYGGGVEEPQAAGGKAANVPLAICAAVLRAKIAEAKDA